nr:molybdopterin dinucleotide binding domain-containing protein [Cetobacterium sp. 8H]
MDEYEFFKQLALSLNLSNYPQVSKEEYLNKVLSPLKITLNDLKKQDINIQKGYIAWENLKFKTPSGKIEIYSETALKDGFNPLPIFIKTLKGDDNYPIRLVSPHSKESLFSQHNLNESEFSQLFISPLNFNDYTEGDIVKVSSKNGSIYSQIFIDPSLKQNEAYIFMKWNNKQGNPNFLTDSLISDIGGQVAYYDTFINIK